MDYGPGWGRAHAVTHSTSGHPIRIAPRGFDATLPRKSEVVIIGGGIVGVCAAWFLAQRGIPVVVCEKGYVGAEQSTRALGWVRVTSRDRRDIALSLDSRRQWAVLTRELGGTGYRATGLVYTASNSSELDSYERWLEAVREFEPDSRLINARETRALLPECTGKFDGALYTPGDGCAEPTEAPIRIAEGAQRLGARIVTQCAVRGLERSGGRICGVLTERGTVQAGAVLIAAGIWSGLLCRNEGIDLPLLAASSYLLRTTPLGGPDICARHGMIGIRRNADGGYTVGSPRSLFQITPQALKRLRQFWPVFKSRRSSTSLRLGQQFFTGWRRERGWRADEETPFERERVHDPGAAPWSLQVWESARQLYPFFQRAAVAESWGGSVDVTPDALPVISEVDQAPGLFIAAGFSGGGFGAAPGAGRLAAQLISGHPPQVDPNPYRYRRFFEAGASVPAM
jgi:glycine/D-amino acid oxidase-like deaminating enzyme